MKILECVKLNKGVPMDKETFDASWNLIWGVQDMVRDYLFDDNPAQRHEVVFLDAIDSAIQELESWKKSIINPGEKSK